jgi:glycosyltransferase involved in cell wall biosynthesis
MKLSIILNTYNHLEITKECLPQTINSCGVDDRQVIINDNGSTDGCKDFVYKSIKPDIFFSRENNIGNPQGVNRCLSVANGEYIAKIDPDFIMPKNWASIAIDLLRRNPDIGLVGFHWAHGFRYTAMDGSPIHQDLSIGEDMGWYYLPPKVFGVWVFKRSLIDLVGCFRDDLSKYGLWDSEFQQRIKNNGLKCVYAKTSDKCYHKGADNVEYRSFKDRELTKAAQKNIDMNAKYWNNSPNFAAVTA